MNLKVAFFVALMSVFTAYQLAFFSLPHVRDISKDKLKFSSIFVIFSLFFAVQLLIMPLLFLFYFIIKSGHLPLESDKSLDPQILGWFNVCAMLLGFLTVYGFFKKMHRNAQNLIWHGGQNLLQAHSLKSFFLGVSTWLISYPVVFFIGQLLTLLISKFFGITEEMQTPVKSIQMTAAYPTLYLSMAISMAVLVPITEELLFRGFLQTWLKGKISIFYAILLSSFIFALFHYSSTQGMNNILYVPALFILSCFLGFLYERERSLWAPIGLHLTFNSISLLFLWNYPPS